MWNLEYIDSKNYSDGNESAQHGPTVHWLVTKTILYVSGKNKRIKVSSRYSVSSLRAQYRILEIPSSPTVRCDNKGNSKKAVQYTLKLILLKVTLRNWGFRFQFVRITALLSLDLSAVQYFKNDFITRHYH